MMASSVARLVSTSCVRKAHVLQSHKGHYVKSGSSVGEVETGFDAFRRVAIFRETRNESDPISGAENW